MYFAVNESVLSGMQHVTSEKKPKLKVGYAATRYKVGKYLKQWGHGPWYDEPINFTNNLVKLMVAAAGETISKEFFK